MAEIEHRVFESVQDAVYNLNADTMPFGRLAKEKLIELHIALHPESRTVPYIWPNAEYSTRNPRYRLCKAGLRTLIHYVLDTDNQISDNRFNCVKMRGAASVCFYSDAYLLRREQADIMATACNACRLSCRFFEWDYPQTLSDEAYTPSGRIMGNGPTHLYRGKLVGFILD